MSQNIRMLMNNVWDKADVSLTLGDEISSLPISYTQDHRKSRVFRTSTIDEIELLCNFSEIDLFTALVIYNHNFTALSTVHVQFYDGENGTGNLVYDTTEIPAIETINIAEWDWRIEECTASAFDGEPVVYTAIWLDEAIYARSIKITIKDTSNTSGYLEIGRVYTGYDVQPDVNFNYGHTIDIDTNANTHQTYGGSTVGNETTPKRRNKFTLAHLNNNDITPFYEGCRLVGQTKDFFISMYPTQGGKKEVRHAYACHFVKIPSLQNPFNDNYQSAIEVKEA